MGDFMDKYIDRLFELADKSLEINDIPVGAIVVKDNEILGEGFNNRVVTHDPTSHAEINAIKDASKKIGDWRLNGCDLYVTLEPCDMCLEVIKESRIDNVYYILENNEKHKYNRTYVCIYNIDEKAKDNYKNKLSDFFDKNLNR